MVHDKILYGMKLWHLERGGKEIKKTMDGLS